METNNALSKKNRIKSFFKTAKKTVFITGMMGCFVPIVKEIYEEITTENTVVDIDYLLFSVVFKHKETRSPQKLFSDVEQSLLEVENLQEALKNSNAFTVEEKEKILQEAVKVISKEASLQTQEFAFGKREGLSGYYISIHNKHFSISTKKIYIREGSLEEDKFRDVFQVLLHEMIHAIEVENIMRSGQVTTFDKKAFYKKGTDFDYVTSFKEINAHLVSTKIFQNILNSTSTRENPTQDLLQIVFMELMLNLYDINTSKIHNYSNLPPKAKEVFFEDAKGFRHLTLEELIIQGMEKKLQKANINYSNINLRETYYYKSIAFHLTSELLNTPYVEFYNSYGQSTFKTKVSNNVVDVHFEF